MLYEKTFSGEDLLTAPGPDPWKVGKVKRAAYHIPGTKIRFLRFGLNMPSDDVFFGVLSSHEQGREIISNSLMMFKQAFHGMSIPMGLLF